MLKNLNDLIYVLFFCFVFLVDHFSALPVGGASASSSCDWSALARDRTIVPCWDGSFSLSNAASDHVRETVFQVQVQSQNRSDRESFKLDQGKETMRTMRLITVT